MDKFLIMLASISWAMSGDSDVNGGWKGWDVGVGRYFINLLNLF